MKRIVTRKLPSGAVKQVQPYHISMKGLEKAILCRDYEDYGVMVKYIAVCANRKDVIVIIYGVVSNHCHIAVLASDYQDAVNFAEELKRNYAQWFQTKYLEKRILRDTDVQAILLDSDWYVRNALAYIPRNAIDNGGTVDGYKWTGFRAMFSGHTQSPKGIAVCHFTRREQDRAMHTRDSLKDVPWLLDADGDIMPETFCDIEYLEQAFNGDQAFWLKTIGALNAGDMEERLVEAPRTLLPDSEFFKLVADISQRWFATEIAQLPHEKKIRLLPFIWRSRKTTINQLARVLGLERKLIESAIKAGPRRVPGQSEQG